MYSPFMKKVLTIFLAQRSKLWTQQDKLNGIEEIAFPTAIPADYHIMLWTERFYLTLTSERSKTGNNDLFNMHRCNRRVDAPELPSSALIKKAMKAACTLSAASSRSTMMSKQCVLWRQVSTKRSSISSLTSKMIIIFFKLFQILF